MTLPGKFISLEGGEGAGKSTQINRLGAYLRDKGFNVIETREVGGCPSAEDIRHLWLGKSDGYWDPLTEVLLIMAARREHLTKVIWPALDKGTWVISDRFIDSTRAYQGIGLKVGLGIINQYYSMIAGDFTPDLTLLLDVPVEVGLTRVARRNGVDDRYQRKDQSFHQILREAYLALAEAEPKRIKVIDSSGSADAIAGAIQDHVTNL